VNLVLDFWNLPLSERSAILKGLGIVTPAQIACLGQVELYKYAFTRIKELNLLETFREEVRKRTPEKPPIKPDSERGLYNKYEVIRLNDTARKHADCSYFVLDLVHDKFAPAALWAYSKACEVEFPRLAVDLAQMARDFDTTSNPARTEELMNQLAETMQKVKATHRHPVYDNFGVQVAIEDCREYGTCPGYTSDVEAVEP